MALDYMAHVIEYEWSVYGYKVHVPYSLDPDSSQRNSIISVCQKGIYIRALEPYIVGFRMDLLGCFEQNQ